MLPARAEGYGLVILEAMSFGLPVIASRIGAFPEIVEDGETGILVPPGDASALAETMVRLATDHAGARALGDDGRRRFEAHFTRERFHDRTLRFYERALGTRSLTL